MRCIIKYIFSIITFKQGKRKRHFYYKFILLCSIYFIANIIFVTTIDNTKDTDRYLYYYISHYILLDFVQIIMLCLYNPSLKCNSSFPFHQRIIDDYDHSVSRPDGKACIFFYYKIIL